MHLIWYNSGTLSKEHSWENNAKMGKDDPPYFKSLRPSKTSPNWALHTYLANRWEYPTLWTIFLISNSFIGYYSCNIQYKFIMQKKKKKKEKRKEGETQKG